MFLETFWEWAKRLDREDQEMARRFDYPDRSRGPRVPDAFYNEPVEKPPQITADGKYEIVEWDPDAHKDADDFNPADILYIQWLRPEIDWEEF